MTATPRRAGRRMGCLHHMRQLGHAASLHADAHGRLPAGSLLTSDGTSWGLTVPLLPFLEEKAAFDATRPLAHDVDPTVFRALSSRAGAEVVTAP